MEYAWGCGIGCYLTGFGWSFTEQNVNQILDSGHWGKKKANPVQSRRLPEDRFSDALKRLGWSYRYQLVAFYYRVVLVDSQWVQDLSGAANEWRRSFKGLPEGESYMTWKVTMGFLTEWKGKWALINIHVITNLNLTGKSTMSCGLFLMKGEYIVADAEKLREEYNELHHGGLCDLFGKSAFADEGDDGSVD